MASLDPKIAEEIEAAWALRDAELGRTPAQEETHTPQWTPAPSAVQDGRAR